MKEGKIGTLVCDANILIDYYDNNKHILKLASTHCYDIYVPTQVFNEVRQISAQDAKRLGIKIVEPTLAQLVEAANESSALSDEDNLCFIIARDNGWICATNEKRLYNECKRKKVATIRGLRIMIELNKLQKLSHQDAVSTARKIQKANPRIAEQVIQEFIALLR